MLKCIYNFFESRGIRKWKKTSRYLYSIWDIRRLFWAGRTSSKLFLFPWLTKLYSLTVRLDRLFRQLDSNFLPQGQNLLIDIEEIFQKISTSFCRLPCQLSNLLYRQKITEYYLEYLVYPHEIKRPEFTLWAAWIFGWQSQNFCGENFGLSILNTSEQKLLKPFFVQL